MDVVTMDAVVLDAVMVVVIRVTKMILRMRIHVAVLGVVDPEVVIAVALAAVVLTEVMPQTGQTSL